MSHSLSPVTLKDVPLIVTAEPVQLPKALKAALWVLVVLGIAVFVVGATGADPKHAWLSLQVNFLYWFYLAAASTCFGAAFHIANAQWARPIRRLFEASSDFFLWSLIPFVVLYFGHHHIFVWSHEPAPGKELWLTSNFVYGRGFFAILILALLARKLVFFSLQRDFIAIRKGLTGLSKDQILRWQAPGYAKFEEGCDGDPKKALQIITDKMGRLSPWLVAVYAVLMTLLVFDQVMSVDPHWYSTLFGAFGFMTAVYLAMAWNSINLGLLRELHPIFRSKVERRTLHDLGKLLFGFGIFWAYLFWSHYLTIWYANMPEETHWILMRLRERPWHAFAWAVLGMCWIVPFLLGLSRDLKQVPLFLGCTGMIVAVGIWMQQYLLIAPSLYPKEIPLRLSDLVLALGFMAAFFLSAASFLGRYPLMPFGDLYLQKEKH